MVTKVHFRIGRTVASELLARNLRLNRKAFLLGNVFPDFIPHIPGHSLHQSKKMFDRLHRFLMRRKRKHALRLKALDSFLVGVLSHYAADYTCAAHQQQYTDTMRRHLRYERDMFRFLKLNPQTLSRSFSRQSDQHDTRPLSGRMIYRQCDNFADELTCAADAVRMVCAASFTG